jgi:hypothetical protein
MVMAVAAAWWQWRWGQLGAGNRAADTASIGAVAAAQQRWWRYQCCKAAAWQHDGGDMRTRDHRASIGAVAAAQQWWWQYQCFKAAAWQHNGGDMRTRDYKVSNYETDDKAELMEKNFGNEGEDDDTFRGRLA